jgi:DNA-binding transcriptional MerR regulator
VPTATKLLTTRKVAAEFGVNPATVVRWADAGVLRVALRLPVSGQRRFDPADVAAFRARMAEAAGR